MPGVCGGAVMLRCPLCGTEQPDVGRMAAHLVEAHLLAPSEAIRRAREIRELTAPSPTPKEDSRMPNATYTCSKCGTKGHNARSPECPKRAVTAAPSAPETRIVARTRPSPNVYAGALTALRAERTELDTAIAALERLEARGRW